MSSPAVIQPPPPPAVAADGTGDEGLTTLVDALVAEQQRLSAVETFSRWHERGDEAGTAARYSSLLPASPPAPGQQYAFEVDLDACSGCKACVSACHHLNGLDPDETWRDIGLLVGEAGHQPVEKTVTTACHHCADPACARGCPTLAYHKDPVTGIVRHLDDQCIGCQYCQLQCPYDVPKFNSRLGIVRKCDMCQSRLAAGEAPACVQACPNEAIRIRLVPAAVESGPEPVLPGTVPSSWTRPSTRYVGRDLGGDTALVPADSGRVRLEHAHPPLEWMLVLTQAAAGLQIGTALAGMGHPSAAVWPVILTAWLLLTAGLAASALHLGRPLQGWRAVLGWRQSWLSREVLVFGPWFGIASLQLLGALAAATPWPALLAVRDAVITPVLSGLLQLGTATAAVAAVGCSAMVYISTRRPGWHFTRTISRFGGTTLAAAGLALMAYGSTAGCALFAAAALIKLRMEHPRTLTRPQASGAMSWQRHAAAALEGPLRSEWRTRRWLLAAAIMVAFAGVVTGITGAAVAVAAGVPWLFGERLERRLFFRGIRAPRMPGLP